MAQESFRPTSYASSAVIAVTTAATAYPLPQGDGNQVRIVNEGTGILRVGFGTVTPVPSGFTTTSGATIMPSQERVFTLDNQLLNQGGGYVYAYAASAGNINVTRGSGQ